MNHSVRNHLEKCTDTRPNDRFHVSLQFICSTSLHFVTFAFPRLERTVELCKENSTDIPSSHCVPFIILFERCVRVQPVLTKHSQTGASHIGLGKYHFGNILLFFTFTILKWLVNSDALQRFPLVLACTVGYHREGALAAPTLNLNSTLFLTSESSVYVPSIDKNN